MKQAIISRYFRATLDHPFATLAALALIVVTLAAFAPRFQLDASAESLVLAEDRALKYYRAIRARYGSDDFLIVTYAPSEYLFAPATLTRIRALRDRLAALERVESVTSLIDVPLLQSPPVTFRELQEGARTLLSPGTDIAAARKELTTSPLYRNLLVGADGRITAIRVDLERDRRYHELLSERNALRERALERALAPAEKARLRDVSQAFREHSARLAREEQHLIAEIRRTLEDYRGHAEIHLAGIPMIVSDMVDFIRHDVRVFGLGAACFIIVLLALAFRGVRWVLVPLALCTAAGAAMIGYLGLAEWPVTVVSSNFVAVLLIITLSLCVHLIVRYEELHAHGASRGQRMLLEETMRSKFVPSLYTALTTAVAFGSLTVSGIRPVIDFGWIMVTGVAFAFVLVVLAFPAGLAGLAPTRPVERRLDLSGRFTQWCARIIATRRKGTLAVYGVIVAASVVGISRLSVENRFTDYFKDTTEIHRGMVAVDRNLGGTTPLDVILEAPRSHSPPDIPQGARAGFTGSSYWFNMFQLDTVKAVHNYLESLPDTGKVLSIATGIRMLEQVHGRPFDDFALAIVYQRLPERVRETLFAPYISDDGSQVRFGVRVYETNVTLDRDALLERIRAGLQGRFGFAPEDVRLTGMVVLYNNVLQSLFRSQVLTLAFVFAAILGMFALLFRSLKVAAVAIVPNLAAAAMVLGLMGGLGIALDIMTITIAAITLGIGVDDTIHYTHRFAKELRAGCSYREAAERTHASVGRALVYTSMTIALGFAVFMLSSFVPTIYFGLLAGFAMLAALITNLTLLPVLLAVFEPLGLGTQPNGKPMRG